MWATGAEATQRSAGGTRLDSVAGAVRDALEEKQGSGSLRLEEFARAQRPNTRDYTLAWFALGYVRIENGQFSAAIEPLERAIESPGTIGDYITYNLALAYVQAGRTQDAIRLLSNFSQRYPDSLLRKNAAMVSASAFVKAGAPKQAIALLEPLRASSSGDVELALGRAWLKTENPSQGVSILQELVYFQPLSSSADAARRELLDRSANLVFRPASIAARKNRADALLNAKRWGSANEELNDLLHDVPQSDISGIRLKIALALRHMGKIEEARRQFALVKRTNGNLEAQRLFVATELARAVGDEAGFSSSVAELRRLAPASTFFEQSLLSAANYSLLRAQWNTAAEYFRELERRFPSGKNASYAHWKAAWLEYRQGNITVARRAFDSHITKYPRSREFPAATYWRARIAERDGDHQEAQRLYRQVARTHGNTYYGQQAASRTRPDTASAASRLAAVRPAIASTEEPKSEGHAVLNPHSQRSRDLERAGFPELAARELRASRPSPEALGHELRRIYTDAGLYHRALLSTKSAFPVPLSVSPAIPSSAWQSLFPIPEWPELETAVDFQRLEPYLVLALIRQESEFNPHAVSAANAVGLMQLLPSTATIIGRQLGHCCVGVEDLKRRSINLQIGASYLRQLLDEFGGRKEYALAAYNAGSSRVRQWLSSGPYDDIDEFVESIPFTETREYVQAILRNEYIYHSLYD